MLSRQKTESNGPPQTSFQDRNTVLGIYPLTWIVEHYFAETLGITYEAIAHTMRVHWTGAGTFSTKEMERTIVTVRKRLHHLLPLSRHLMQFSTRSLSVI